MGNALIDQAIELLEKANADLQPELLSAPVARRLLASYARARRLVDFGITGLSRKLDDASELARVTGTSMGKAKALVSTGKVLATSAELSAALQQGDISLDQAGEIAAAEESCPGAATELVAVAQKESFHVLKDKPARQSSRPTGEISGLASTPPAMPEAISTSSAWSTSILPCYPTSGPRSSLGPRPRRPG